MSGPVLATARLLDAARAAGLPVVFTTIAYDAGQIATLTWLKKATGMAALELGSRLVEIDDRLARRPDEHLVVKTGASAFFGTALASYLTAAGADTVIVTGATTSGCVRASVVDAVQHGFPTLVPRDCVADRAAAPHEASLFDIHEKYGDVVDLDDVLAYVGALPAAV
jgi:nicotinamidase-related amidase